MDGWYANFVSNSTKVHVVLMLSWGFDNNTYEIVYRCCVADKKAGRMSGYDDCQECGGVRI